MKKTIKLIQSSILLLALIVLASCSTEKSKLTATPQDAGFVMVVNGKTLKEKGNIQNFADSKMYKKIISEISDEEMQEFKQFNYLFENGEESGIAINDEFIFFMKMEGGAPAIGMNFLVLDQDKVKKLFVKVTEKETDLEVKTEGDISYISHEQAIIAWNAQQLVVLAQEDIAAEALLNKAKELLAQSASESISSNSIYSEFYKNRKDISVWFNYDLFMDNMPPAQQMMIASQLPFSMKGTYFYGYVSFEKGQVIAEYESVMNDEMKSFLKDYHFLNDDFDTDVLKMLPKNTFANLEMSINFLDYYHMFIDIYKEKQVNTEIYTTQVEQEIGMSIDDLLESFSGEIAMSLHGVDMQEKTAMSYGINEETGEFKMEEKTSMQPSLLYSSVIKFNNDKVWKIIEDKAAELNLEKQANYYTIPQSGISIGYINNTMLITNDLELLKQVMKDGSIDPNMTATDVPTYLNNFPTYMELNMDLDQYPENVKAFIEKENNKDAKIAFKFMKTYTRLQVIPTDIYSAKIILQLKDDSRNSLDIILHDIDEASELISQN